MLLSSIPVIAWSPFGSVHRVAIAAARAGALGVVDVRDATVEPLERVTTILARTDGAVALRLGSSLMPEFSLPNGVCAVVGDTERT